MTRHATKVPQAATRLAWSATGQVLPRTARPGLKMVWKLGDPSET